ncbi:hypothetical protein Tsubulata_033123, partial [Turnera subulata]
DVYCNFARVVTIYTSQHLTQSPHLSFNGTKLYNKLLCFVGGGLCKVQVAAVVVAAWVCLTLVVGSGAVRVGPSKVEEEGEEYPYPAHHKYSAFKTVEFSIDYDTSAADYKEKLIDVMRDQLKYGDGFFGIPSLPSTKVSGLDRFGLVKLNYDDNGQSQVQNRHNRKRPTTTLMGTQHTRMQNSF